MTTSLFAPAGAPLPRLSRRINQYDHALGHDDAAVTLVFYGDYQCRYSRMAHLAERVLVEQFGPNELRLVYRHFPLTGKHPLAFPAAISAEAAARQGRFWEMHHELFRNQDRLDPPTLLRIALDLELDIHRFRDDLASPWTEQKVARDFVGGIEAGVQRTPSFFANGARYEGPYDAEEFPEAVRRMVEAAPIPRPS
ncbi:MAG: hypothetical protein JWO69_1135 [Thermoleophilia bacterium]|nr:hypothetical protein [Thermoleophilia bacterium]